MTISRRKLWTLAVSMAVIVGLTGCGASSLDTAYMNGIKSESSMEFSGSSDYKVMEEVAEDGSLNSDTEVTQAEAPDRKLIKTVEMTVETKEFDAVLDGLNEQIKACGGYVESMNTYNGSIYNSWRSSRDASMTIRIPVENLDTFLDTVTSISNVIRRSDKVEDVTLTYVDLQSHKEALQTEQTRLLELLEKAESVEDIITIEERLSDVRYQIESMESQLRTYDNKITYSTVNLEIEEVQELTPVEEETVWQRISGGFVDSLHSVADGFVEFGIWLIVNSPFLVIWAIVITAAIWILRKWNRRRFKKKAMSFQGVKKEENTREIEKNE